LDQFNEPAKQAAENSRRRLRRLVEWFHFAGTLIDN
jgi:hypothetical protein